MSASTEAARQNSKASEDVDDVRTAINAAIAGGISVRTISEESSVPYGTLAAFVKGTYNGRNENIADRLRPWLSAQNGKTRKRTGIAVAPGFIMTPTAEAIMDALEFAQHIPDIIVITGAPGVGKTEACAAYAQNNSNVWLVTANPSMRTAKALLAELADVLALPTYGRAHSSRLSAHIIKRLTGTSGLVIVDEAQHLQIDALEQLRAIFDLANVGVALAGNATVKNLMDSKDRSEKYAQLFSRVGFRVNRPVPAKGDVGKLLDAWNLTNTEVRRRAEEIAREPGALRSMTKALRIAKMAAEESGASEPTEKQLSKAWRNLLGVEA
ncbi:AAA family ATPase [Acidisoma sp. 7E03]